MDKKKLEVAEDILNLASFDRAKIQEFSELHDVSELEIYTMFMELHIDILTALFDRKFN